MINKLKRNAVLTIVIGMVLTILGGAIVYLGFEQYKFANKVIELPNGEKGLLLE